MTKTDSHSISFHRARNFNRLRINTFLRQISYNEYINYTYLFLLLQISKHLRSMKLKEKRVLFRQPISKRQKLTIRCDQSNLW